MIEGKTKSGFTFSIPDDVLDDYELLEILHKVDKGEYGYVTEMSEKLLGIDQKNALLEHLRASNGRVSAAAMLNEVMEIFQSSNAGKN